MNVRLATAAGQFYPECAEVLRSTLEQVLIDAVDLEIIPKALIAPHSEYRFSADVAASAYKQLMSFSSSITRVVLIGPVHQPDFDGLALPDCDAFSTPLGTIPLDLDTLATLRTNHHIQQLDSAHQKEYSLEVQCPFLQSTLTEFTLVPILTGNVSSFAVGEVIETLWGGDETLFVISTDLSHYHSYEEAWHRDRLTTQLIEQMSGTLTAGQACGHTSLNGALEVARRRGLKVTTLDVQNSGDTTGEEDHIIGFGSYLIHY